MQFPTNPLQPQSTPFMPKNLLSLYQALTMNSLYNFSMPPATPELYQAKLYQSMFEKFLQSQNLVPKVPQMQMPMMSPYQENPFMGMFYDTYLKLLKTQILKTSNIQTNSSNIPNTNEAHYDQKSVIAIKEEFNELDHLHQNHYHISNNTNNSNITNIINNTNNAINAINANNANSSKNISKSNKMDLNPEACIKEMLFFFVKHVGSLRRNLMEKEGEKIHQNDEDLKEVFNGLLKKFLSSKKTKEEKIKYVLRKCFKYMKDKLLEENGFSFDSTDDYVEKLNSDKVEKMFFKHYFSEKCGKSKKFLTKNEITFIKDISMPFR